MMADRCEQIQPLLSGYALEALSAEERWLVEEHLDFCRECRTQLEGYLAVGDGLLNSAPAVEPPAMLRARLIAAIAEQTPEVQSRPSPRFTGWRTLVTGLLSLLILLNGFLFFETRALARRQERLTAQLAEDQTALGLAAYPNARSALVQGEGTYGTLLYDPDLPFSVLYAWGLEPLGADETYQAWLIEPDGDRVNGGIFQADPGTGFVRLLIRAPQDLSTYVGVGVTVEPRGGSPGPTGPRVLGADL